ncbi:RND transporter [Pandoraea terrae]|uniref:RND transporter n=1 Tax=Pandoraea terrae TaxID=1537710 RepID=A0A5E4U5F2_9BURK|nr:MMPL family transporter [Pandoraea terrae]VVD95265.1 RND transporter [Pandoraea terrae]
MKAAHRDLEMPVVRRVEDFDLRSGNLLERLIFNYRSVVLALCVLATVILGTLAFRLTVNASYEDMSPRDHPFVANYTANQRDLKGLGNTLRVVVENPHGDIFDAKYLDVLARINDQLVLLPGVDRAWVKSLWSPLVRWTEVTEEGFSGGAVMPEDYDASSRSIEQVRRNVLRGGLVGSIVANDFRSTMIVVPLAATDANGASSEIAYADLSKSIERIRQQYEATGNVRIHVIGFAKLVGDLIDGIRSVMWFFAAAAVITALILYGYTRCVRSTILVVAASLVAVVWQLGLLRLAGLALDPYSIMVPFLVFAIGVSHGAQKMNGIMQDIANGTHRYVAARYTFRRLFLAGLTALVADAVGFAVLALVDIPVIRHLAFAASVGVGGLVFSNLILIPVILSFTGVSARAAQRSVTPPVDEAYVRGTVERFLARLTRRGAAAFAVAVALVLGVGAWHVSTRLAVGDLHPGAPELRTDARYNRDVAYIGDHYGLSSDVFAVIVKTVPDGCMRYETMARTDRLTWLLSQTPGVQAAESLADRVRLYTSGAFEGNPKWYTVSADPALINPAIAAEAALTTTLMNGDCSVFPIVAYLQDHKAETLKRVVGVAQRFADTNNDDHTKFLLAAGSAGIDAATNEVVARANLQMLLYVYAAVVALCFITFRNWRAVVVAVLPLMLTSVLCEALMVYLGIGVKVATLPVVALGVGIGVDYALYLLSVQLQVQRSGANLADAYLQALHFTGKVVALIGFTLAAGVLTWVASPIKFQADTGALLAFMFVWNMLGAIVLIPALSHFLLNDWRKQKTTVAATA